MKVSKFSENVSYQINKLKVESLYVLGGMNLDTKVFMDACAGINRIYYDFLQEI